MYGRKKYGRKDKSKEYTIDPGSLYTNQPTYLCDHCKILKIIDSTMSCVSVQAGSVTNSFRLCASCVELLRIWIKN